MTLETFLKENDISYFDSGAAIFVYERLNLRHALVEELPQHLCVKGDLVLYGSKVSRLPDKLYVQGRIYVDGQQLREIPPQFQKDVVIEFDSNSGYAFEIVETGIRINYIFETIISWKRLFRKRSFFEMDPEFFDIHPKRHPISYREFMNDFKRAAKLHEHYFGS